MKQNVNDVLKFREGLEQGAYQNSIEIAKSLLSTTSLSVRQISDITKLPIIEIEELKSEIQ